MAFDVNVSVIALSSSWHIKAKQDSKVGAGKGERRPPYIPGRPDCWEEAEEVGFKIAPVGCLPAASAT